jgi:cytosine/adenosine deaminase-related metal-dependent hydrolase
MSRLFLKNIHTLVTMDERRSVLHDVDLVAEHGRIRSIGKGLKARKGDEVIDGRHRAVYPGFINTHHHLYQTLTRNLPKVQNAKLFDWLVNLYEVWRGLGPEAVEVSTQVGLGELLLSGCTTTTDHFYVFPKKAPRELIDVEIDTARRMGVRFHPTRGSMSRGRSVGGLPPDDVVQTPDEILKDCERVIRKYHDPEPLSMCRIALAPCSPFSVTTELLRETAEFARKKRVLLHTHLCETTDEERFCLEKEGLRPLEYMEKVGWVGPDVWYAHGIHFNDAEIRRLGRTRTGVAHCPCSNLRLGSGIAPIPKMLKAGVRVGLAVDGSASNDSSSFLREMQFAMLVHRVGTAVDAMPPLRVLEMATLGGADILCHPELGRLVPGSAADLAAFRLDRIDYAGALHDPASAVLFCGGGQRADLTVVAGKVLVRGGRLVGLDEEALFFRANKVSERMVKAGWKGRGR